MRAGPPLPGAGVPVEPGEDAGGQARQDQRRGRPRIDPAEKRRQAAAVHHRDLQYGHRAASYPGPIGPSAASCHSSGVPQPHPHGLPLPSTRAPAPTTTSYDSQPALQVAQAGTVRTLTAAEAAEFSKTLREVSTTLPEEKVVMDGNKLAMVYRLDVPESVYSVAPFATVCYSYDLAGLSLFSRVWLLVDILG